METVVSGLPKSGKRLPTHSDAPFVPVYVASEEMKALAEKLLASEER